MGNPVEIAITPAGRITVHIGCCFDEMLTAEEAADAVRMIWQEYVEPLQPGFKAISAPYREEEKEMERRYYDNNGNLVLREDI